MPPLLNSQPTNDPNRTLTDEEIRRAAADARALEAREAGGQLVPNDPNRPLSETEIQTAGADARALDRPPELLSSGGGAPQAASVAPVAPIDEDAMLAQETARVNAVVPLAAPQQESFTQEMETQGDVSGIFSGIAGLQAPQPFNVAERQQQLFQEYGIQSLGNQLSLLDNELNTFDATVNATIAQRRNRITAQSIINTEIADINRVANERRQVLINERQFVASQIDLRNNIVNSFVNAEQQTFENELNSYNSYVDRAIRIYELEQNARLRDIEIAERERAFYRAESDYILDKIGALASRGFEGDEVPQSLRDQLRFLSEKLYEGNADFLPDLATFMFDNSTALGGEGEYFKLGETIQEDGSTIFILGNRRTGSTLQVSAPGVSRTAAASRLSLVGRPYEQGGVIYQNYRDAEGNIVRRVVPGDDTTTPVQNVTPNRDALVEVLGVDPLGLPRDSYGENIARTVLENLQNNEAYIARANNIGVRESAGGVKSDPQAQAIANRVFEETVVEQFSALWEQPQPEIPSSVIPLVSGSPFFIGADGSIGTVTAIQGQNFLRQLIRSNLGRYRTTGDVIDDINERPDYFRRQFIEYIHGRQAQGTIEPLPAQGQTIPEPTTSTTPAADTGGTIQVTLTTGEQVQIGKNVNSQYRDLAGQIFGSGQRFNVLAIIDRESGGDTNAVNKSGENSIGLMQVNLNTWSNPMKQKFPQAGDTLASQEAWLKIPENNIRMGKYIYDEAGGSYGDWSVAPELGLP